MGTTRRRAARFPTWFGAAERCLRFHQAAYGEDCHCVSAISEEGFHPV